MPISLADLMTRQAISPRLAMRIFLNICVSSERNVVVLAPRVLELLLAQHRERAADALARRVWRDHVVDVTAARGDERVGELLAVGLGEAGNLVRVADVLAEDDLDRALRPHDRDL